MNPGRHPYLPRYIYIYIRSISATITVFAYYLVPIYLRTIPYNFIQHPNIHLKHFQTFKHSSFFDLFDPLDLLPACSAPLRHLRNNIHLNIYLERRISTKTPPNSSYSTFAHKVISISPKSTEEYI
ncbi:hypothetical protein EYC80_004811 [Monilinia laxa]|uniref:Uncharacterized protein n=1 Tax=Monilinia laxa TaxID=61186 RepID=A0A5N6KI51_MONLA|nr:hypothetical protein EYC80_004811 [Monilinia laxa]